MTGWIFTGVSDKKLPAATVALQFGAGLPQGLTATRASAALGRDNSGRWVNYDANILRAYYDPANLDGPYALIEPASTQLIFTNRQPAVTPVQGTSAYNATVQTPFGPGAVVITPNSTVATHGWNFYFGNAARGSSVADNTTLALQAVLKPFGTITNVTLFLLNRSGVYSSVRFDMSGQGSVVTRSGVLSADITADTDGFYTLRVVNNVGTGTTEPSFNAGFHDPSGTRTFAGDGASGVMIAYMGAEAGLHVTSPVINTGTSTVNRAADVVTASAEWILTGGKTLGIDYVPLSNANVTILDITGNDAIRLGNNGPQVNYIVMQGSVVQASVTAAAPAPGIPRTVVVTAGNNSFTVAQDGSVAGRDTSGNQPSSFGTIRFGAQATGDGAGPMLLRQLKYWSTVLDNQAVLAYSKDLGEVGQAPVLPSLTIQNSVTVEPVESTVTLTVVQAGAGEGVTFLYRTVDGSAVAGRDYVGTSGTVDIPAGQTSAEISVGLMARGFVSDLSFQVEIYSARNATIDNGMCAVLLLRQIPAGVPASTKIDFGATLPAEVTLSRSTPAWTRNSTGLWTQVAANGYRHHFESATVSGLLLEPAGSEQRLYDSVDINFTASGGTKSVVTTGDTPTGTRVMQFRDTLTTEQHRIVGTLNSVYADMPTDTFTTSFMIRPVGSRRYFRMTVKGIDNVFTTAHYDCFGAGTMTGTDAGTVAAIQQDPFRPEWYRISPSRTQTVTAGVTATISIVTESSGQGVTIAGEDGAGFDICHVQVEPTAAPTSPIIVTGATAKTTRTGDALMATGTWYQLDTYSIGMRFIRLRDDPTLQTIFTAKDSSVAVSRDDNGFVVENGTLKGSLRHNNTNHPTITGPAVPLNTPTTVLMTVNPASAITLYSGGTKLGQQAVGP